MALELLLKKEDPKVILVLWEGEIWKEMSKSLFFNELRKIPFDLDWSGFLERFSLIEERVGKRYAFYLLSQRALLSSELKDKLLSKGISSDVAAAIIRECVDKGFLDDRQEVARLVAKELKKGLSSKAVFFKLRTKKRIDESLLHEHLDDSSTDAAVLQKWLAKHAKKIDRENPQEMRKWMAKLCRKGFSPELIFKTLGDN